MMRQAGVATTSSPKDRIFSRQKDRFRFAFPVKWMYVYVIMHVLIHTSKMCPLLWKHDSLSCTLQIWPIRQVKGNASPRIQIIMTAQAHIHILMRLYHIYGNLYRNVWFSRMMMMYLALCFGEHRSYVIWLLHSQIH